jgi:Ni/Co efflux regulator RcnB
MKKLLLIALALLPSALCAMDKKAFDKAVQQCNPGSQKQAEEWKRLVLQRAAAQQQEQQRQRQIEQEKYRHGMNQ